MSSLASKASSGVKWTAFRSLIIMLTGIIQVSVLGRILEPDAFGVMAMLASILGVANVFVQTGFSDAIIAKKDATETQLSTLYWLNIASGAILFAFLQIAAFYFPLVFQYPGAEVMLRVIACIVLIASFSVQYDSLMKKHLLFRTLSIIQASGSTAGMLTAIISALLNYGVWSLVFGAIMNQLFITLATVLFAARCHWWPRVQFNFTDIKDYIHFGLYRIGAALINQVNSRADHFLIGFLLGPVALGYYSIAYQLIMTPFSKINPILTQVSFPVFAIAKNDNDKLSRGYRKGLRILMAINAPVLVGAATVAPEFVPIMLGPGWEKSVILIQILAFYVLMRSVGNISVGLILAKEKFKWPLYWNCIILFIVPVTIYATAVLSKSVIIICIVLVSLQFFLLIMNYVLYIRRLLGPMLLELSLDFGTPVLIAIFMGFLVISVKTILGSYSEMMTLISLVLTGSISYLVLSLLFQREMLKEIKKVLIMR